MTFAQFAVRCFAALRTRQALGSDASGQFAGRAAGTWERLRRPARVPGAWSSTLRRQWPRAAFARLRAGCRDAPTPGSGGTANHAQVPHNDGGAWQRSEWARTGRPRCISPGFRQRWACRSLSWTQTTSSRPQGFPCHRTPRRPAVQAPTATCEKARATAPRRTRGACCAQVPPARARPRKKGETSRARRGGGWLRAQVEEA